MRTVPYPADEASRQQALDDLELVDTPAEQCLDTLVRLTRELFQVKTVLISLIDHDRQWFKARIGLDKAKPRYWKAPTAPCTLPSIRAATERSMPATTTTTTTTTHTEE